MVENYLEYRPVAQVPFRLKFLHQPVEGQVLVFEGA